MVGLVLVRGGWVVEVLLEPGGVYVQVWPAGAMIRREPLEEGRGVVVALFQIRSHYLNKIISLQ